MNIILLKKRNNSLAPFLDFETSLAQAKPQFTQVGSTVAHIDDVECRSSPRDCTLTKG